MKGVDEIGGPVMSQDTTGSIEVAKKWYTVSLSQIAICAFSSLKVKRVDYSRLIYLIGDDTETV